MRDRSFSGDEIGHKAHLYSFAGGFLYVAPRVFGGQTKRHPGVLLMSLSGKPFTLHAGDVHATAHVAVVAPRVERAIELTEDGIASLNIEPGHPAYGAFASVAGPGCRVLDQTAFQPLLPALRRCLNGAPAMDVPPLCEKAINIALTFGETPPAPLDPRIEALLAAWSLQSPLDYHFEEARRSVQLSPGRLSHMFTHEVGVSIRSFLQWRKTKEAMNLLATRASVTEIAHQAGFADSAHLTRTLQNSIGLLPSMLSRSRQVQVHDLQHP